MSAGVEYNPTIKELPSSERPRERLLHYGANALATAELLAIILRTGTRDENVVRLAQRLLIRYGGLAGLARANTAELSAERGLGPAKTTQLKAALELGRRLLAESPGERPQIRSPAARNWPHVRRGAVAGGWGTLASSCRRRLSASERCGSPRASRTRKASRSAGDRRAMASST